MFKQWLAALMIRHPKVMARLVGEWPLASIAHLYENPVDRGAAYAHEQGSIPCNIYQTWTEPLVGKSHAKALERFKVLNPEYRFWLYDSNDMDAYMRRYYSNHPIYPIYQQAQFGPVKTDIWRYCILYERGGFYFDINKMVEVPLRTMVQTGDQAVISFEQNDLPTYISCGPDALAYPNRLILNWGFGFVPGHPLLAAVMNNIVADYPKVKGVRYPNVKEAVLNFTGPHQLTKTVHQLIRQGPVAMCQAGVDFNGAGNANIRGSWVRYASQPSYSRQFDGVIVY